MRRLLFSCCPVAFSLAQHENNHQLKEQSSYDVHTTDGQAKAIQCAHHSRFASKCLFSLTYISSLPLSLSLTVCLFLSVDRQNLKLKLLQTLDFVPYSGSTRADCVQNEREKVNYI